MLSVVNVKFLHEVKNVRRFTLQSTNFQCRKCVRLRKSQCTLSAISMYSVQVIPKYLPKFHNFYCSFTGLENNGLSDYYLDSYDHSSSESGFTSLTENRIGHRLINTSHNSPLSITNVSSNNSAAVINQQNATNNAKTAKRFSILHAFVPSFMFVVVALVVLTIFILESESDMVSPIRDLPEMKILKYQYYQPLKDVFANLFINQ